MGDLDMKIKGDSEKDSRFNTWVIPLPDFQLNHEPSRGEEDYRNFIGREELTESFIDVLKQSSNQSGSYLVTGYRGVGKTSFVKHALKRYSLGSFKIPRREKDSLVRRYFFPNIRLLKGIKKFRIYQHRKLYKCQNKKKRTCAYAPLWRKARQFSSNLPIIGISILILIITLILFSAQFWGYEWDYKEAIILFFVLPLLYKYILIDIYRPFFMVRKLYRRLFRPVVEVHINLGYEISNPKGVLFGIISLLHNKYNEALSLRRGSGIFLIVILLALTTIFATSIHSEIPSHQTEASLIEEILRPEKNKADGIPLDNVKKMAESAKKIHFRKKPEELEKGKNSKILKNHLEFLIEEEFERYYIGDKTESESFLQTKEDKGKSFGEFVTHKTISLCQREISNKDKLLNYREYAHPFLRQTYCSTTNFINSGLKLLSPLIPFTSYKPPSTTAHRVFYFLFLWLGILFLLRFISKRIGPNSVKTKLNALYMQTIATESTESLTPQNLNIFYGRRRQYHPLDIRQAENQLLDCLEHNRNLHWIFPKLDIIFIFDELDKIRPLSNTSEKESGTITRQRSIELGLSEMVRARKLEVEALLGSLKNLITVAPCRFIFIAGREMMDANLADRGETRHLYGSLFDQVLYVPSFLTDGSDKNHSDISSMVEQYVCRRLMQPQLARAIHYVREKEKKGIENKVIRMMMLDDYDCWNLRNYDYYLKEIDYESNDRIDLVSFLQDFIYFLTYRSAGNPKKLAVLFEEFIKPEPFDLFIGEDEKQQRRSNNYYRPPPIPASTQGILRFDFADQYRIKLISNTFIMLHGEQSRLIQAYGDKLSVAVFTILDYIFKFHSTGFCFRDLERMPDVLDIHRAPALPNIIDMILKRLLQPYLRRMSNGIYDFRFLKHFQSEVMYLSQFSEDDLAAFNFSLDESIQIKQHYKQMLDEQMKIHEQAQKGIASGRESGTPHVLPYLHTILGDLHFLDKEFDQARTAFRNAVQYLEPSIQQLEAARNLTEDSSSLSDMRQPIQEDVNQILLYVRLLLKIGLLEEQRGVFDSATAVYYQASRVVDHVLEGDYGPYFIRPHLEQLNVLMQPYICLAFLHAKRDPLTHTAELVMKRNLEKVSGLLLLNYKASGVKKQNSYCCESLFDNSVHTLSDDSLLRSPDSGFLKDKVIQTVGREYPTPIMLSAATQRMILARFHIRQAEMRLLRSDFIGAMVSYTNSLHLLSIARHECSKVPTQEKIPQQDHPDISSVDENIGMAFIGLGDAASGNILYQLYSRDNADDLKLYSHELGTLLKQNLQGEVDEAKIKKEIMDELKDIVTKCSYRKCKNENEEDNYRKLISSKLTAKGLNYYILAAMAFILSGNAADARLALWKLSYVLTVGFSYLDEISLFSEKDRRKPIDPKSMQWLFGKADSVTENAIENPLQRLSMRAFGFSYQAHTKRLARLFKNNLKKEGDLTKNDLNHHLCWSAAPLSQSATVMGRFWLAYWVDQKKDFTDKDFSIRQMGPFPVNARILAYYFKARWYLKKAQHSFENAKNIPCCELLAVEYPIYEKIRSGKFDLHKDYAGIKKLPKRKTGLKNYFNRLINLQIRGLRMLIHCIEAASFFEGGEDSLTPPLGLVYYHVWATLKEIPEGKIKELSIQSFFRKELRQYLQPDFCRARAIVMLRRMLDRHNSGEAFFNHVHKKYYLYDEFSDNYTNVSWSVEYGLTPIAKLMLKELQDDVPFRGL